MISVKKILCVHLLLSLCVPAWAVNKCTGADGKMVYQDAPCAGQGETLNLMHANAGENRAASGSAQAQVDKLKRDNEMAEAIRTRKPLVGMTVAQLQEAMGPATKVNAANYQGVQQDQIIYERPNETWYVYTRQGVVQSVQNQPGAPLGVSPRAQIACPSQHEIHNAKVSASSNMLGDAERAERLKSIRLMEACGR